MPYFEKRKKAFGFAIKGLRSFFTREDHPRIHGFAALFVLLLAYLLNVNIYEWLALLLCIALVLSVEAINSALEKLTDIVSPEFSEKAGDVKDIAAGAVLITALASLAVGLIIFIPKIIILL